jgi:hypothetical protein
MPTAPALTPCRVPPPQATCLEFAPKKNMKSYRFNLKLSRGLGYARLFRLARQVEAGVGARVVARVNAMGCA